jgi:hypothetical protein
MRLDCPNRPTEHPCDAEAWKQYSELKSTLLAKYRYCKVVSACTEDEKTKIARDQYVVWGEASYSARRYLDEFWASAEATDAPHIPKGIRGLNTAFKVAILLWPTDVYQDLIKPAKIYAIRRGWIEPDSNMTAEGGRTLGQVGWELAQTRAQEHASGRMALAPSARQSDVTGLPGAVKSVGASPEAKIYRTATDMTGTYFFWTNGDISYISRSGNGNFGPPVSAPNGAPSGGSSLAGANGAANIRDSTVPGVGPSQVTRDLAAGGGGANGNHPFIKMDPTFMHGVRGDGPNGDIFYLDGSNGSGQGQQSTEGGRRQQSPVTSSKTEVSPLNGTTSRSDTPFTDLAEQIFGPNVVLGAAGLQVASLPEPTANTSQPRIDAASYQKAVMDRLVAMDGKTFGDAKGDAARYASLLIADAYKNDEPPDVAAEHIKRVADDFLKKRKETADARKKASQPVVRRPTVAPSEPEVVGDSSVDYSAAASALLGIAGAVAPMVGRVRVPTATVRTPTPAIRAPAPAATVRAPVLRAPAASQSDITGLGR